MHFKLIQYVLNGIHSNLQLYIIYILDYTLYIIHILLFSQIPYLICIPKLLDFSTKSKMNNLTFYFAAMFTFLNVRQYCKEKHWPFKRNKTEIIS